MNVNQTSVQLLKILASQQKIKKSKKTHTKTIYPKGIENKYKSKLSLYFKPLIDYVNKYINENKTELLKGDSKEIKLDAIPGESYRNMVKNMEGWLAVNIPENPEDNSRVYLGLKETANQLKDFQDKEFEKQLEKSIGTSIKEQAEWWNNMIDSWSDTNYQLIKSNARNFVNKINVIVEQSITNGTTVSELKEAIQKATSGLSDAKCRLLARDQIGKLQGQISQGQMTELGLELYIWSTSGDERVRDSHQEMEGLLCRWDDASVYSEDGGKTWIPRPSGAIEMHPGQDIQCRCVALAYFPEIDSVITGEPMEIIEPENNQIEKNYKFEPENFKVQDEEDLINESRKTLEKFGVDVNNIPKPEWNNLEYRKFCDELPEQLHSIFEYTNSTYTRINRALGTGDGMTSSVKNSIKNIDDFMKQAQPLKKDSIFYRGESFLFHKNWKVGDEITSPIFSSASLDKDLAEHFDAHVDLLKFYAPKGSKCGSYIGEISRFGNAEKEFLMKRDLKFKILSKTEENKTITWNCLILN